MLLLLVFPLYFIAFSLLVVVILVALLVLLVVLVMVVVVLGTELRIFTLPYPFSCVFILRQGLNSSSYQIWALSCNSPSRLTALSVVF